MFGELWIKMFLTKLTPFMKFGFVMSEGVKSIHLT